jgi:hypothetical protein
MRESRQRIGIFARETLSFVSLLFLSAPCPGDVLTTVPARLTFQ